MKRRNAPVVPDRDSVCFLTEYHASAEDLAAFIVEDNQRRAERRRDRRQRKLLAEAQRGGFRP